MRRESSMKLTAQPGIPATGPNPVGSPVTRRGRRALDLWKLLAALYAGILSGSAAVSISPIVTNSPAVARSVTGEGVTASPIFSADGQWLFFASSAPDLVDPRPRFNGLSTYRRNLETGVQQLLLPQADDRNLPLSVSADGNRVLIRTDASNLVSNTPAAPSQLVLLTVDTGVITPISFDSVPLTGTRGSGDGLAGNAAMSKDGRWVVFESAASNLVPESTNSFYKLIFLDALQGTRQILYPFWGRPNDYLPELMALSDDGKTILINTTSSQSPLFLNNEVQETSLHIYKTTDGTVQKLTIPSGKESFRGIAPVSFASLSPDGGSVLARVGFLSQSGTNRIGGAASGAVVHWNLATGKATVIDPGWPTTTLGSDFALRTDPSLDPALSDDGLAVLFHYPNRNDAKKATELRWWSAQTGVRSLSALVTSGTETPTNSIYWPQDAALVGVGEEASIIYTAALEDDAIAPRGFFRRRLSSGATTALVQASNGSPNPLQTISYAVGPQAEWLALTSDSSTVVEPDRNRAADLFLLHLANRSSVAVNSRSDPAERATRFSASQFTRGGLSANGRWTVFTSDHETLVTNDFNLVADVFLQDAESGRNTLVSVGTNGSAANRAALDPILSADGRAVVFSSAASDLVPGTNNQQSHLYYRDLLTQRTLRITHLFNSSAPASLGGTLPAISADGNYVAYYSDATNLVSGTAAIQTRRLYLYQSDLQQNSLLQLPSTAPNASLRPSISGNGSTIAVMTGIPSAPQNLIIFANYSLAPTRYLPGSASACAVSADGRRVAYSDGTNVFAIDAVGSSPPVVLYHRESKAAFSELQFASTGRELLVVDGYGSSERRSPQIHVVPVLGGLTETLIYPVLSESSSGQTPAPMAVGAWMSGDSRWVVTRTQPLDFSPRNLWATSLEIQDRDTGTRQSVFTNLAPRQAGVDLAADGRVLVFASQSGSDSTEIHRVTLTPESVPLDADADGLPDVWERRHFHTLQFGPNDDVDRDGADNLAEYLAGTSPVVAPHEVSLSRQFGGADSWIQLDLKTTANAELRVFSRPDLATPWTLTRSQLMGAGASVQVVEPIKYDVESKFLKFEIE